MENIDQLINKYWDAETTTEEEKELRDYFNSSAVASEHHPYIPYFKYLSNETSIKSDFNPLAKVEIMVKENLSPERTLSTSRKEVRVIDFTRRWQAVAAMLVFSILCMWGVGLYLNDLKETEQIAAPVKKARIIEINDLDDAKAYTEDAMNLIAFMLKSGTEPVTDGLDKINQTPVIGSLQ